jgi:hypothetical protein
MAILNAIKNFFSDLFEAMTPHEIFMLELYIEFHPRADAEDNAEPPEIEQARRDS